ncbi:MAG: RNA-binding transcriptional accessory protein [Holophagales bacterium]|nr:RNA-binding transcriptional accessory protein [Holophagales bacterium]
MEQAIDRICKELTLPRASVAAVMALLSDGNTVPFIARYRKEATGSLDEVAIRSIEERMAYFKDLLERRATVLNTIEKSGKLTDELRAKIDKAWTKIELEDLYLPYKPKKRTKATIAKEQGLEPLLDLLLEDGTGADPMMLSGPFAKEGDGSNESQEDALPPSACVEGAGHILAERLAESAEIRAWLRKAFLDQGVLTCLLREDRKEGKEALRFRQYWDFRGAIRNMPPHRVLAIRRGEKENILSVKLVVDRSRLVSELASKVKINPASGYRAMLQAVCEDAFDRLLAPSLETEIRSEAKKKADAEAIKVFKSNLDHLLLAPPAGQMCTLGVDPGIRTGCKLAIINRLGQFMETATVYPLEPKRDLEGTAAVLEQLMQKYPIETIAVGNGTGGREAEAIFRQWLEDTGRGNVPCVSVSESGASVYSASEVAREEFPDLDVTVRGAISIARRFQDPLAELVKIEPKSIGVGQYQHDVNPAQLKKGLDESVESCVNRVGVDLNSASYKLLSYVAGIGEALSKNIVQWRYEKGAFQKREQLLEVPRFGEKAFQQAAGFLRVRGGENPLDASAVHPESYSVVQRICQLVGKSVPELIGNEAILDSLDPKTFIDEQFGPETVADIIAELKKPGRDPRQEFEAVHFNEGVNRPSDVEVGMELQGIVTNVTDFGAFVDFGVHQDGLVHLSEIGHRFIKHPSEALAIGQQVKVKVTAVDLEAKRINLSIKALLPKPAFKRAAPTGQKNPRGPRHKGQHSPDGRDGLETTRTARPPKSPRPPREPKTEGHDAIGNGQAEQSKPARPSRPSRPPSAERAQDRAPRPDNHKGHVHAPIKETKKEANPAANQSPASTDALAELMAKFNKGLR